MKDQCLVPRPLIWKTNENTLHDQLKIQLFPLMISKPVVLVQNIAKGSHPVKYYLMKLNNYLHKKLFRFWNIPLNKILKNIVFLELAVNDNNVYQDNIWPDQD